MYFELRIGPQGHIYLPKKIRDDLIGGEKLEVHTDLKAGVIVSKDTNPEEILESLNILRNHFKQLARAQER